MSDKAKPPEWRDEWCRCGHRRGFHFNQYGGTPKEHNPCMNVDCRCVKFTWTAKKPRGAT